MVAFGARRLENGVTTKPPELPLKFPLLAPVTLETLGRDLFRITADGLLTHFQDASDTTANIISSSLTSPGQVGDHVFGLSSLISGWLPYSKS